MSAAAKTGLDKRLAAVVILKMQEDIQKELASLKAMCTVTNDRWNSVARCVNEHMQRHLMIRKVVFMPSAANSPRLVVRLMDFFKHLVSETLSRGSDKERRMVTNTIDLSYMLGERLAAPQEYEALLKALDARADDGHPSIVAVKTSIDAAEVFKARCQFRHMTVAVLELVNILPQGRVDGGGVGAVSNVSDSRDNIRDSLGPGEVFFRYVLNQNFV